MTSVSDIRRDIVEARWIMLSASHTDAGMTLPCR